MVGVGIFRGPKVFASAKVRVYIIQVKLMFWYYENGKVDVYVFVTMVTVMFWCYENGEATVTNASERYDV